MIDAIRTFFRNELVDAPNDAPRPGHDPIHVAACALLLEVGYADDSFGAAEREHLLQTVQREFSIDAKVVEELVALAEQERRESVDLFQFTRLVVQQYDLEGKGRLVEGLWRIVYADGTMTRHEHFLMRKITQLLDLDPAVTHAAQQRAKDQLS